jgi:hypothetical protein
VYRTPWLSKALGAAAGFDDLSDEQKGVLGELRTSYERELGTANAKWAAAITARDEKSGGPMMAMMRMGRGGNETDDEVSTARKERKELDDRYKAKIEALLNTDQIARLPEETRESGDDGFMGMMAVDDLEGQEDDDEDPR